MFWMIKKIDYQNLKICTQTSKQTSHMFDQVAFLFAYLFLL